MVTVIRADRLIDGTGAAPMENAAIVLDGERIAAVHTGPVPDGTVPPGTEVLEFPGCTILPGLIDTHVHLNMPGDGSMLEDVVRETDGTLVATSTFTAQRALEAGITTVRDVGGARRTVFDLKRAIALGHGRAARIAACGQPITITGGHTWYFGGEADGEEGLRLKVREMCRLGADFIKVMASGGGTVGTMSWVPSYSATELAAIADEAHRMGRKVTAHCLCAESSRMVVAAGFDGIEHAGFIVNRDGQQRYEPDVGETIARAGIPVTGTLAVGGYMLRVLGSREQAGTLTAPERVALDRWRRMFDDNLSQFRQMLAAGVTFVAGTDAGWRYTAFEGLPLEMELMQEGGMPAMDIIVAATSRAASVPGLDGGMGTLAPGKLGDVLVVGGDPLADLSRLTDVRLVMQGGHRVTRHAA